jgi:hypothetical protein
MKARAHPHAPLTRFAAAELPASEKHLIEKITKIGVGSCGVGCTGTWRPRRVCHDVVFLGSAGTRAGLKALARGLAWDLLLDACSVLAAAGSILLAPANASFKGVSRILYRFEHRSPSWNALLRWQQTARSWRLGRDTVT